MLENLSQFTGSKVVYRHPFGFLFTEGAKYVADEAGAYWLLDEIGLKGRAFLTEEPFQVWKLTVKGHEGKLITEDGNGNLMNTIILDFTDFPEPGIELWFIDNVILLPSEY